VPVVIYVLAFTGGFVIMSLELLGGRVLAPYFGSSIYVWGSIITVFMLSLALGYLFGGKLSLHRPSLTRFGTIFAVAAVLFAVMNRAPVVIDLWPLPWRIEAPTFLILLGSLAFGLLIGLFLAWLTGGTRRWRMREYSGLNRIESR